ncbi:MAG: hypothetical protein ACI915_005191, partial [Gammaproteobacteria bacterium]
MVISSIYFCALWLTVRHLAQRICPGALSAFEAVTANSRVRFCAMDFSLPSALRFDNQFHIGIDICYVSAPWLTFPRSSMIVASVRNSTLATTGPSSSRAASISISLLSSLSGASLKLDSLNTGPLDSDQKPASTFARSCYATTFSAGRNFEGIA